MQEFAVGLADIGLLIGLYLAPGIAIAYPGGSIGRRFGDKHVVASGMLLMIVGGTVMALDENWGAQVARPVIAGTGGVLLNVLMSKMVQDWFAGREIASAMAIFVISWPVGIAAALLVLPAVAEIGSLGMAAGAVTALVAAGLVLLLVGDRAPDHAPTTSTSPGRMTRTAFRGIILAGLIWGLFNAALAMIFGFGPAMLTEGAGAWPRRVPPPASCCGSSPSRSRSAAFSPIASAGAVLRHVLGAGPVDVHPANWILGRQVLLRFGHELVMAALAAEVEPAAIVHIGRLSRCPVDRHAADGVAREIVRRRRCLRVVLVSHSSACDLPAAARSLLQVNGSDAGSVR